MSAFIPIGLRVSARMRRSPSRSAIRWTNSSVAGCTIPIAPASEAAATSSTLLHGYIAPQMSGTAIPAWRVSGVASPLTSVRPSRASPREPEPPAHAHGGDDRTRGVADLGEHVQVLVALYLGHAHARLRDERAARLLRVRRVESEHDPAHVRGQCGRHREPTRQLAQVGERHGVDRPQVVAYATAVA